MINLLSPIEKEFLQKEKVKRLIVILGTISSAFLICLILILFSIKTYISGQVEYQKITLFGTQKEYKRSEGQALEEKINQANLIFSEINSFYQQKIELYEILERISQILPEQIRLDELSVNSLPDQEGFKIQVSLSGFAPDREVLFEFKNRLENDKTFEEIYFPATNWLKPADIDFYVSCNWVQK